LQILISADFRRFAEKSCRKLQKAAYILVYYDFDSLIIFKNAIAKSKKICIIKLLKMNGDFYGRS